MSFSISKNNIQSAWTILLRYYGRRVPRIEKVLADPMPDGRLLLQIKDLPFERPVLSRFASDGTLKMLAYLTVLHGPEPPQFVGIEEPENFLHPRLLPELAEECRSATARSQLLVTTHSPFFLNAIRPEEVRVLYRDEQGYTQVVRASEITGIPDFVKAGASMGHLWLEGRLGVGDPLVNAGAPQNRGLALMIISLTHRGIGRRTVAGTGAASAIARDSFAGYIVLHIPTSV